MKIWDEIFGVSETDPKRDKKRRYKARDLRKVRKAVREYGNKGLHGRASW